MRTFRTRHINASVAAVVAAVAFGPWTALSQETSPAPSAAGGEQDEEEVILLSPFEVTAENDTGYVTSNTLAGNRLNTELRDLGTSLSVYNTTFLTDIGATDNQSLLKYTLGTEVGGIYGNYSGSGGGVAPNTSASFANPQSTNRVRGLIAADNTRDLYLSSIPWDSYNVDAVDLQRGPNAILFGQGSPGGVINTRTKQASYRNLAEFGVRVDEHGSFRATVDVNQVILDEELAIRFAGVHNQTEFQQKPAFEDFDRGYLALRYEPGFLKRGRARTIFKADVEVGNSLSNRPRNMPPGDNITPWFTDLDKQLFNVAWMNDQNWELPGRGIAVESRVVNDVSQTNPNYSPWVNTNFGANYFGGSIFFYNPGSVVPANALAVNPVAYLGLSPEGERDGTIGGLAPSQPKGIRGYRDWAIETDQPFASLVKDRFITDPKIFDFYDKLLDGNIKREWSDFQSYNFSVSQTFFDDQMGIDFGVHDEKYTGGGYSPIAANIYLDFNTVWPDGTNTPGGWYTDGTQNPGAGRPFLQMGNGSSETTTDRRSFRLTAFATHDFNRSGNDNWLTRFLGTHTLTAVGTRDDYNAYTRNWTNAAFTGDYYNHPQFVGIRDGNGRFWADFVPIRAVYLGDSLVDKNLGDDFNLDYPQFDPVLEDTMMLRYFDSTWNQPTDPLDPAYVDPGAVWFNQVTAGLPQGPTQSTQSENPANYVGWGTRPVDLLRATDDLTRELLTNGQTWDDRKNEAYAFVWQGKFLNNSIIGTAGWRHDEVSQRLVDRQARNSSDLGSGDPSLIIPNITELGPVKENSKSWGVVAHLNTVPFLERAMERLPLNVSLSFNESENFQTGQIFVDYFGQQLPLPKGETEDFGVLLATKDGKYSLKVNKFESTVSNNASSFMQFWTYGNNVGVMARHYHQIKHNYEVRGDPTSQRYGTGIVSDLPVPTEAEPNPRWNFDYQPLGGQTLEEAEALEIAVISAWDQWLEELAPLPQMMAEAWNFNYENDLTEGDLANFRLTSELVAEGYEFEFNAQITDSWRLTANASRIKSTIDNIGQTPAPGGEMTQIEYLLDFDRRMNETAMGDLRMWGPNSPALARENWNGFANGDLKARLAEQGTTVPENRLWHVNVITNYDFQEGRFHGWTVGGALRYQSAATLAYMPVQFENFIGYDLNAPYRDDSQIDVDVWLGYNRRVFQDKVNWSVKLNVANVGVGNELIPVTVQPDGTPAAYRIRPPQYVFLTNTFSF